MPSQPESDKEVLSTRKGHQRHPRARESAMECNSYVARHGKNRCIWKKDWHVICLVIDRFQEAFDYQTYCLAGKSSGYDDKVDLSAAKVINCLKVQMISQKLNSFDLFLSLALCQQLYRRKIQRVYKMVLHFGSSIFMKCPAAVALKTPIALRSKSNRRRREGTVP